MTCMLNGSTGNRPDNSQEATQVDSYFIEQYNYVPNMNDHTGAPAHAIGVAPAGPPSWQVLAG